MEKKTLPHIAGVQWYRATSLSQVQSLVRTHGGSVEFSAGGTGKFKLPPEAVGEEAEAVVQITGIPELIKVTFKPFLRSY